MVIGNPYMTGQTVQLNRLEEGREGLGVGFRCGPKDS